MNKMPNFDKIIEKTMRYKEYVNKEIVQITEKREMQKKSRSLSRNTKLNSQESIKKKKEKINIMRNTIHCKT